MAPGVVVGRGSSYGSKGDLAVVLPTGSSFHYIGQPLEANRISGWNGQLVRTAVTAGCRDDHVDCVRKIANGRSVCR